ncbi:MAG: helix-turn-helix domain-containing protein [Solirubrobacteraceae bacterium]
MTGREGQEPRRLDFRTPHLLRDEPEYDAAVAEIELLDRDVTEGTSDFERLQFLSVLVEAYDEEHYQMGTTSTQQSLVDFMLEQNGLGRSDLIDVFGSKSRVSEFFARKRRLSMTQIIRLRDKLHIPADALIELAPKPVRLHRSARFRRKPS